RAAAALIKTTSPERKAGEAPGEEERKPSPGEFPALPLPPSNRFPRHPRKPGPPWHHSAAASGRDEKAIRNPASTPGSSSSWSSEAVPRTRARTDPASRPGGPEQRHGEVTPSMRILIVDDQPQIARFVKQGLEQEGHTARTAGDGATALGCAREGGFD